MLAGGPVMYVSRTSLLLSNTSNVMTSKLILLTASALAVSCGGWTAGERELISSSPEVMRVLVVDDPSDAVVLRASCKCFDEAMLRSPEFAALSRKMLSTVTSPEQDGVGIAGPQVGVSRRIVAVQRFDKPGEPFEVYPNIRIVATRGEKEYGAEGCLSVPGRRGEVLRWHDIDICYTSPATLRDTTEQVTGFTSVIFQHECDHLEGILYPDYPDTVMK